MSFLLKIPKLYYAVDGTKEPFELELSAVDFPELPLAGLVTAKGQLMRVEEGVMLLLQELIATQITPCVRCGKPLKRALFFSPSEWLFYEPTEAKTLTADDAAFEHLFLDKKQLEIDLSEPLRQELFLNLDRTPHCEKPCKEFAAPEPGVKALSGLKKLL